MISASAARMSLERQGRLIDETQSIDHGAIASKLGDLVCECEKYVQPEDDACRDQQIILDLDHDGNRYLLIRMPARASRNSMALSPREQEIGRMVAKGYPNKAIAAVLEISSWTVCTHLRRMFAKLGVSSRAAMVAKLGEEGVLREVAGNKV